jgi:lipopolysaccharide biosynthesis protein
MISKIMEAHGIEPEVVVVSNTGRDILPFIKLFETDGAAGEDEFWCHLHQKKSLNSTSGGDKWRRFLLRVLLGDAEETSNALSVLCRSNVGLVAPLDPHFIGWDDNRRLLPRFEGRLPGPFPQNPLLFPVGNMFWVRRSVAAAMLDFFGDDYAWPGEPIPNDGTEYHLIERLWPTIAASLGLESVFLHKLDERRL